MNKRVYNEKEKAKFKKYAIHHAPKSNLIKDCSVAFVVGGAICMAGQAINNIYLYFNFSKDIAATLTSITLIFISCLLTGIGVYDKIAKYAGGGTLVPITGFANAVCSTAIDCKSEGFVMGVGANMFKIVGPVIVFGMSASVVYGVIYWITTLF